MPNQANNPNQANTCQVCPSRFLCKGDFNVEEANIEMSSYGVENGVRVDIRGVATCIHPERVGLAVGRYVEVVDSIELPVRGSEEDAAQWVARSLRAASPDDYNAVIDEIQKELPEDIAQSALRVGFAAVAQQNS